MSPTFLPEALAGQLRAMLLRPVRVTLLYPGARERAVRIPGMLTDVTAVGITVECLETVPADLEPDLPAAVEILVDGNLVWFDTSLSTRQDTARQRLFLNPPPLLETTQRRRHERIDLNVEVHLIQKSTGQVFEGVFRDLSVGGASLRTSNPIPAAEQVVLVFQLGSGLFFENLAAEVVRCNRVSDGAYVVAVRFSLTEERTLAAWVNRQLADLADPEFVNS